jgi:activator of 2-hydroxyglutaryl-CoA dehydratase
LSINPYFAAQLAKKLGQKVFTHEMGIFAGALGAALLAADKFKNLPQV